MKGFVDYNIDYVVKFGGSLLEEKEVLPDLLKALGSAGKNGKRIVLIPGGGPTDNTIERLDKWAQFHENTHHHACALAQDQTGLMASDVGREFGIRPCSGLEEMLDLLEDNFTPVILPSRIMFAVNPFERTWDITSDSMAAWFAWLLNCKKTIILTNVDGVYQTEHIGDPDHFISQLNASELTEMGHTAVDKCFGPFILKHGIQAWVLNGLRPDRINSFLQGENTISTLIEPK